MNTWFDYRTVWARHPWVLAYFVIVLVVLATSIVATFLGSVPLMLLFIPALAGVYVHHLLVLKRLQP